MLTGLSIKRMLRDAAYGSIANEAVLRALRRKRLGGRAVVLMYHELAPDSEDIESWTVVRESDFVRQMEYLSSEFDVVSLGDALEAMSGPERDGGRPMAVVTFDDGYSGNKRTLLPVIKSMNIPVTVFVATKAVRDRIVYWYDRLISALQGDGPIELELSALGLGSYSINSGRGAENWRRINELLAALKAFEPARREAATDDILKRIGAREKKGFYRIEHLTSEEVREISESPLVTIGAHSHCHNILTQLPGADLRESVKTSRRLLQEWTGLDVPYFAYPNGDYDDKVIGALKAEGFGCGLTTESRAWDRADSLYAIPRVGIGRYDSMDIFKVQVSGGIRNLFYSTR